MSPPTWQPLGTWDRTGTVYTTRGGAQVSYLLMVSVMEGLTPMPDDLDGMQSEFDAALAASRPQCEACGTRGGHTKDCSVHETLRSIDAELDNLLGRALRLSGVNVPTKPEPLPTATLVKLKRPGIIARLFRRRH